MESSAQNPTEREPVLAAVADEPYHLCDDCGLSHFPDPRLTEQNPQAEFLLQAYYEMRADRDRIAALVERTHDLLEDRESAQKAALRHSIARALLRAEVKAKATPPSEAA